MRGEYGRFADVEELYANNDGGAIAKTYRNTNYEIVVRCIPLR